MQTYNGLLSSELDQAQFRVLSRIPGLPNPTSGPFPAPPTCSRANSPQMATPSIIACLLCFLALVSITIAVPQGQDNVVFPKILRLRLDGHNQQW